jgi:hypothetical protein
MTEQIERVCPGCGASASDFRFCPSCGRNLGSLSEIATLTDRQAGAASNVGEASTVAGSDVSLDRSKAEYTPPAATAAALRAIEIPAQPHASPEHSVPGVSENGHDQSPSDDIPARATLGRFQTTELSRRVDAEAAETNDEVAPQPPETPRFAYVPAVVPDEAHHRTDIAGQDSAVDDGGDRSPADDAPAAAAAASQDRAQLSEQPSPADQPPAESERESPPVNAVPPRDDYQPRPRQAAPRPVAPIATAPRSSSHRVPFVCLAAVIGLILVMLNRGRRAHA